MKIYKENDFVYVIDKERFFKLKDSDFNQIISKYGPINYEILAVSGNQGFNIQNESFAITNQEKKWIRFPKKSCLVVDQVSPEIKFNGIYDIKTIESIVSQYGKLPDQINMLVSLGKLELLSNDKAMSLFKERDESIRNKVKPKVGIRRKDDVYMEESSEEESESFKDRLIRKAAKI